jgi:lipopolysaccharide export LptBFGC system permease protein LptF
LGEFIKSRSYLVVGYWLIVSAGLSFFFVQAYPFAVLALSPSLGFFVFGLLGLWEGHKDRKASHE